jgi:hypothetical protein
MEAFPITTVFYFKLLLANPVMRKIILTLLLFIVLGCKPTKQKNNDTPPLYTTLAKETLKDKIKGGWAGQVIGVTFGSPVEFGFQGSMINDYQPLQWYKGYIKKTMEENPGVYDDLYMDLTFVDVFERLGLDAGVQEHAKAYANAGYALWHANQAGRYNILHGIKPPLSGHWLNNPHADDIDFQIEADFAGLMSPGMPNSAGQIGDSIGHMMNYGDGWYGGVYVSAMYSLAFVSGDISFIVREALKKIPEQSTYYQCISDVIRWHDEFPHDWRSTWFELQKKWSSDIGCPDGVFNSFNIDAKINSAYIVLGLLYGNGDYTRTLDITARAGQDADCNPSSAGGILGAMLGYSHIPEYWKQGLQETEDIDFKYTTMSLNDVYAIGFNHALKVIERNHGKVTADSVVIAVQIPTAVRLEQSFAGHYPIERRRMNKTLDKEYSFEFNGVGFASRGEAKPVAQSMGYTGTEAFSVELSIDGRRTETVKLPSNFHDRRHELFWRYQLPNGKHQLHIKVVEAPKGFALQVYDLIVYGEK